MAEQQVATQQAAEQHGATHKSVFPGWHWFLTPTGLPVLVGVLALVASVTFNVITVIHGQNTPQQDFEPVGSFRSGELMDAIIQQCRTDEKNGAIQPLHIVADFAAYGALSFPTKFQDLLDVLRNRSNNGRNPISCVFLEHSRRNDVCRVQFKDYEAAIKTVPFQQKVEKYLVSDYGRRALRELHLESDALTPQRLTLDQFITIALKVDDLVTDDLRKWGIQVKFYPYLLTVHAWSGSRDQALMAIVDFEGVVDEAGFLAHRQIAQHVEKIFEIVERGAQP
jgi:hypothetical protein